MAIYNTLRANFQALFTEFNTADSRAAQNASGGVAVWDMPPTYGAIFNPLIFKRTQYLFYTYASESPVATLFFVASTSSITFPSQTLHTFFVHYTDADGVSGTIEIVSGSSDVDITDYNIATIDGLSWLADQQPQPYLRSGNTYYAQNGTIIDDGNILSVSYGKTLYLNTAIDTVVLDVFNPDNATPVQELASLSAVTHKGVAIIDVAPVVRSWLNTNLAEINVADGVIADRALFARYYVNGVAGSGVQSDFVGVAGVVQIGENPDFGANVGKVLTTKPRLEYFSGYPLDYSVLSGDSGVSTPNGYAEPDSVTRCAIVAILTDESNVPILTDAGEYIYTIPEADIEIVERCVPNSPFYIRWTNDVGGVDYWMFKRYQARTIGANNVENARIFVENPYTSIGNQRTVGMTPTDTIKVGSGGLNRGDFEALRKMPFARLIEMWVPESQRWVRLSISSYSHTFPEGANTFSIEVEFALPERYTQMQVW